MKKILYNCTYGLLLCGMITTFLLLSGCQDETEQAAPVITEVRNYAASPDDTVVQTVSTGQWIVVLGKNLSGLNAVLFSGVPASINNALTTNESIVIQIPSIPFEFIPRDEVNAITVVNSGGMASFEISIIGTPIISTVRYYADAPNDTIMNSIRPGQTINIVGFNLENPASIAFQGIEADLNSVIYTDTSAIVQVPVNLAGSDDALVDRITYTNSVGTVAFRIKILGPPIITAVSYEIPKAGDIVYLYGRNFVDVESITFAGETISDYEISPDSASARFVAPALTQSGPVVITTPAGSYTTLYNVNDLTTRVVANFDDISPLGWGSTVSDNSTNYPGNNGKYNIFQNNSISPWDWGAWNSKRILVLDSVQWVPAANVSDPLNSWAVKFDLNVPEDWNGTTLFISSEHNDFKARFEPWRKANGNIVSYRTTGWQTVTVPLSQFRNGWDGTTAPTSIVQLLGVKGKSPMILQTMNITDTATPTGLNVAIDNIRVVKIR
jgi:hypothetical protein